MSGEHICRENIAQAKKENLEPPPQWPGSMDAASGKPLAYPVTVRTAAALGKTKTDGSGLAIAASPMGLGFGIVYDSRISARNVAYNYGVSVYRSERKGGGKVA